MGKALVIVESKAKAKTINKYLGDNYIVKSSIGHIRDLPRNSFNNKRYSVNNKNKKKTKEILNTQNVFFNRIGIDPYHGWKAKYEILPGKEKIVTEVKELAAQVDHIYLATDFDREGEAIAWHLQEVIGGDKKRFSRVTFNEITKKSIIKAFEKPRELNIYQVNAQQVRRFMDRVVGYMISPLLWKKIARGLSAGRVQSVAVRLIVEREREIKTYVPKEYWKLHALLKAGQILLSMKVTHKQKKIFIPINKFQIQKEMLLLNKSTYTVSHYKNKLISKKPSAPFTTSTLQQVASRRFGYCIKKTMQLAQRLYESGYITYMRTDSTNISKDALNMVRKYIYDVFGKQYLPKIPNKYFKKTNIQEAHETIRPSNIEITLIKKNKNITIDEQNLYNLIWCQFVACQMVSAQYESISLIVNTDEFQLQTYKHILIFDGWIKVMPEKQDKNEKCILPIINTGQQLILEKLLPSQHFTKPPIRYSEALLVKELEKRGIGRPSTYVPIITSIQNRGYVFLEDRRFYAKKIGEIVTNYLEKNFHEFMNYDFTAKMENSLDQVAINRREWKSVLDNFFNNFTQQLKNAEQDQVIKKIKPNIMVITNINCPVCNNLMNICTAITGVFLGCSGYKLPPEKRCKKTINLVVDLKSLNSLEYNDFKSSITARHYCEICNTCMDSYFIDDKRKIYVCGNSPLCHGYKVEYGQFYFKNHNLPVLKCEKCNTDMELKLGRFGKYMACINNFCKNTRKVLRNGNIMPPKEDPIPLPELLCKKSNAYFVLRNGISGVFLAAHTFPKSRETRIPLVKELVRIRDRLPEKLRYLADAPIYDDEGNQTWIYFNRKTKQQYVSSIKKDKNINWTAFYINGQWQVKNVKNK